MSLFFIHLERVRVDIAVRWHVTAGRLQVLTDSQHAKVVGAQIAQHLKNFHIGFTQPDHQAGLGWHVGMYGLEALQ